ncbi:MAG: hypothetical protein KAJ35_09575 [Thermoplasmata archaeon]|nr:hypothetical protein [Thermoplasmata archaeon]
MRADEWMDLFRKHRSKSLFSLSDLVLLTGDDRSSLSVQLSRMVGSGMIERPVRGWYSNPFAPHTDEELAMVVRRPSYLSMEYALARRGVLSQAVHVHTLVTTSLPYTFRTGTRVLEYHQVKKDLFWGYQREGNVLVAEPEKALLDLVYVRFARGRTMGREALRSLIDDMYIEDLDGTRLAGYADSFDTRTRQVISEL